MASSQSEFPWTLQLLLLLLIVGIRSLSGGQYRRLFDACGAVARLRVRQLCTGRVVV